MYQQRVKQADVARKLMAEMRSAELLNATNKALLETMIRVPDRPPKNADERAFLAQMLERNARRLEDYAIAVLRAKEKDVARFRKTYGV